MKTSIGCLLQWNKKHLVKLASLTMLAVITLDCAAGSSIRLARMTNALTTSCVPDTLTFTPTPTIRWDDVARIDGYHVWINETGNTWIGPFNVPCFFDDDTVRHCPSTFAVQRATNVERGTVQIQVSAFNEYGEGGRSESLVICMPDIWQQGETYQ